MLDASNIAFLLEDHSFSNCAKLEKLTFLTPSYPHVRRQSCWTFKERQKWKVCKNYIFSRELIQSTQLK